MGASCLQADFQNTSGRTIIQVSNSAIKRYFRYHLFVRGLNRCLGTPSTLQIGCGQDKIRVSNPDYCVWHPERSIPLPSAYATRSFLLQVPRTVPYISKSVEYFEFEAEMVNWIDSRLRDSQLALSDTQIAIILGIVNWEVSFRTAGICSPSLYPALCNQLHRPLISFI